jgi:signal transduction histidine kinase
LAEEAARRDAEETVSALLEQALELEKMKGVSQLAAGAAHDVRNLVCAMRLAAGNIAEDPGATSAIRASAAQIVQASDSAMSIARDLETLGPYSGHAAEVVSPHAELQRLLPLLRTAAGDRCPIELRTEDSVSLVFADRVQLDRLVLNLVLNARDAMPEGGTITLELSEATLTDGRVEPGIYLVLTVSDSGVGMPPHVLQRVFEPYFTTKAANTSSGLGLTVVYAIADRFGGFVHVESEPGRGTKFRVYFPRIAAGRGPRAVR